MRDVRSTFNRFINIYEFESIYTVPLRLMFVLVRLFMIFGFDAVCILVAISLLLWLSKVVDDSFPEANRAEERLKQAELGRVTIESFNCIRVLKQNGWEDFFHGKMADLLNELDQMKFVRKKKEMIT